MLNNQNMIERIDNLAKSRGMSRNKLLQECGVKSYVDNLVKGQIPKIDTALKIATYCDISLDYLICRTDNPDINT